MPLLLFEDSRLLPEFFSTRVERNHCFPLGISNYPEFTTVFRFYTVEKSYSSTKLPNCLEIVITARSHIFRLQYLISEKLVPFN
jgi:hypothetical protein